MEAGLRAVVTVVHGCRLQLKLEPLQEPESKQKETIQLNIKLHTWITTDEFTELRLRHAHTLERSILWEGGASI